LVVVDASWYLPTMNRAARAEYHAGHIPGAVYADIDSLSDRAAALPHMFPAPDQLGREIGLLGIGNDSRVVVYDGSGANLSAARFWWTLRVLGHEAVAVLDGGLQRWRAEGRPLRAGFAQWAPRGFAVRFRPELIRSEAEVGSAIASGTAQLLDARSRGRFEGTEPEPRPGLRGGHLPGARSLPFAELTGPGGTLLAVEQLQSRFARAGLNISRPVTVSCGSGVTACALLLGLAVLGHSDHALYDGSWSEWGREGGPAIQRGPASAEAIPYQL
jgi:thiosulfate/3-mercaptopyruvate sulfurtransferase